MAWRMEGTKINFKKNMARTELALQALRRRNLVDADERRVADVVQNVRHDERLLARAQALGVLAADQ